MLLGCWTCRKRHQKCDETKPGCLNCRIRGTECGGYGIRLAEFTVRGGYLDGQMVSKVTRGGPREDGEETPKPHKRPRRQVARTDEAAQDLNHRSASTKEGSVNELPTVSPQVDSHDIAPRPNANPDRFTEDHQLTEDRPITTCSQRSGLDTPPRPAEESRVDPGVDESTLNCLSPVNPHGVADSVEALWQDLGASGVLDLPLQFSIDPPTTPSLDLESYIDSPLMFLEPVPSLVDAPVLDLDPGDGGVYQTGHSGDEDDEGNDKLQRTAGEVFPGLNSSSPPFLLSNDPFEQYLFCHCTHSPFSSSHTTKLTDWSSDIDNLALRLYPIRPDSNPYLEIYGSLATRSLPLRSAIIFASAFHLSNLGRLPKFAIQPYRKAMRQSFRDALATGNDIEGLAATALLSVIFDVRIQDAPGHCTLQLTRTGHRHRVRRMEFKARRLPATAGECPLQIKWHRQRCFEVHDCPV